MSSTDVATRDFSTEVEALDPRLQALLDSQEEEFASDTVTIPLLKIGQPLTREVGAEQAEPGEFINTALGEGIGDAIGFIVVYYHKGRFAADRKTGRGYAAGFDIIPDHWEDLVGPEFVGTRFDEHPDAEEVYKARVNAKEIEWGSGPLISTTYNFTGFAIVSPPEGSDEPDEYQAVRLSLKRTDTGAARKIKDLKKARFRKDPFWFWTYEFKTEKRTTAKGPSFNLVPKLGRPTTDEERRDAQEFALKIVEGKVVDNAEKAGDDSPVEPDAKGGLGL